MLIWKLIIVMEAILAVIHTSGLESKFGGKWASAVPWALLKGGALHQSVITIYEVSLIQSFPHGEYWLRLWSWLEGTSKTA